MIIKRFAFSGGSKSGNRHILEIECENRGFVFEPCFEYNSIPTLDELQSEFQNWSIKFREQIDLSAKVIKDGGEPEGEVPYLFINQDKYTLSSISFSGDSHENSV